MKKVLAACTILLLASAAAPLAACGDDGGGSDGGDTGGDTDEPGDPETLADFDGAPTESVDGPSTRLTCLGDNQPESPTDSVLQLTGYVRTLADPDADEEVPSATVEAFAADGTSLVTGFADPSKSGRVAVSVPVTDAGWTGYAIASHDGYMSWRFQSSRAVTSTAVNGWAWLTTTAERDALADDLGVTVEADTGILVGTVHDCDVFGTEFAVVTVDGDRSGVYYIEGFAPVEGRTWTSSTGRFVVPNLTPGAYEIKAWGRLEAGGELVLLSVVADATVEAGQMTAISLQPRVGLTK